MSIADFPERESEVRPGTYQTVVRPHQLKRTDVITETFAPATPGGKVYSRRVVIDKVTYGEITYRGRSVPVLFVYGRDDRLNQKVVYTRTGWDFIEVTRIGDPPQFAAALRNPHQFIY